jgi:hypothetical protein
MLCASLFFWLKILQKENSFLFFKENILSQLFFLEPFKKYHKLIFQESITTVIITIDYNFEETFENINCFGFLITLDALGK